VREQQFFDTLDAARNAVKTSNWTAAENIMEGWLATSDGGMDAPIVELLADVYFRRQNPQQALAILAPRVSSQSTSEILLRGSLASARTGRVFQGQREFVVREIVGHWTIFRVTDNSTWLPQGNTPHDLEIMSCLALGTAANYSDIAPRFYLSETLRLDPGNPLACYAMGGSEVNAKHYAAAERLFEAGLARCSGKLHDSMLEKLKATRYLRRISGQ
jgi:hypothetical protein